MKIPPKRKKLKEETDNGDIIIKRSDFTKSSHMINNVHSHDYFELILVMNGHMIEHVNGTAYDMKRGSALLMCPTDFHYDEAPEPSETLQIHFSENMLDEHTSELLLNFSENMILYPDKKTGETLISIMMLLLEEYNSCNRFRNECIKKLFDCLIIIFLRNMGIEGKQSYIPSYMQKAVTYIHMHFRDNPSLGEVCSVANMSRTYFCRLFKEYTGVSFVEYMNTLKLNYARKLLHLSDLSVTEICFRSGFNSESNFLRVFKSEIGISPQKYKMRCKTDI